jgi:hypothetical protein
MFHIRQEGSPFKTGLNFQYNFKKYPYIAVTYCSVDFNTDTCYRWGFRLRFYKKPDYPLIIITKRYYNIFEERLKQKDAVAITQEAYEYLLELKRVEDEKDDRRLKRVQDGLFGIRR